MAAFLGRQRFIGGASVLLRRSRLGLRVKQKHPREILQVTEAVTEKN